MTLAPNASLIVKTSSGSGLPAVSISFVNMSSHNSAFNTLSSDDLINSSSECVSIFLCWVACGRVRGGCGGGGGGGGVGARAWLFARNWSI